MNWNKAIGFQSYKLDLIVCAKFWRASLPDLLSFKSQDYVGIALAEILINHSITEIT